MAINPKRKQYWFDKSSDNPGAWLAVAERLRLAADRIDYRPISFSNPSRIAIEMVPIQKMLLGLSFENLLKGLLIAMGRQARENGRLAKSLREHRMQQLIKNFMASELQLTKQETDLLEHLENYVIWHGRYPVPCNSDQYDFTTVSNQDQQKEQLLWDKLRTQLRSIGWMLDANGNKIPLNCVD